MPRGDGTGPNGMGPMTGRAAGYCAGFSTPGYMNPAIGGGMGRGMAWGRGGGMGRGMAWGRGGGFGRGAWGRGGGFGRGYAVPAGGYSPVQAIGPVVAERDEASYLQNEKTFLERQLDDLKSALKSVDSRLNELDKETKKK